MPKEQNIYMYIFPKNDNIDDQKGTNTMNTDGPPELNLICKHMYVEILKGDARKGCEATAVLMMLISTCTAIHVRRMQKHYMYLE